MNLHHPLAATALALCCLGSAQASVVSYDSISGNTNSGYGLYGGYFAPFDQSALVGLRFTASASGYIDALTLAVSGVTPAFSMTLFADNAGTLGSELQTLAMTGDGVVGGFSSGAFGNGTQLTAGADYWLVLGMDLVVQSWYYMNGSTGPGTGAMLHGYAKGPQVPTTLDYLSPTQSLGMIVSINDGVGNNVPEPASYGLVGLGLLGLVLSRRRSGRPQA